MDANLYKKIKITLDTIKRGENTLPSKMPLPYLFCGSDAILFSVRPDRESTLKATSSIIGLIQQYSDNNVHLFICTITNKLVLVTSQHMSSRLM